MTLLVTTMPTPAGPLTVLVDGDVVVAAGFTGYAEDLCRRLTGGRGSRRHDARDATPARCAAARRTREPASLRRVSWIEDVSDAVAVYLDGEVSALDTVPAQQAGGPFLTQVWAALWAVPVGQTRTYTQLAAAAGRPTAVRAAGTACARNLLAPFVPCHRIVRRDGGLGGYAYGLAVKRWLLDHEHRHAPT